MTPKAAVSALRRLPLFERVSLRLLNDLVEFASLEEWWDDPGRPQPAIDPISAPGVGILHGRLPDGTVSGRRFRGRWLNEALRSSFSLARAFPSTQRDDVFRFLGAVDAGADKGDSSVHCLFLTKDARFGEAGKPGTDIDLGEAAALLARALVRTTAGLDEGVAVATLGAHDLVLQRWDAKGPVSERLVPADRFGAPAARPNRQGSAQLAAECAALGPESTWHVVCVVPKDPQALPLWWRQRMDSRAFHRIVYLTRPGHGLCPPPAVLNLLLPGAWDPVRQDGPYFSSVVPTVVLGAAPTWGLRPLMSTPFRDLPTLEVIPWQETDNVGTRPEPTPTDARLRRDLCRIRLKLNDPTGCDGDPAIAASLDRWARAVTNRQVGIALSGGGATSAALLPFLEDLALNHVPVDVVSSFSGGAILGLYLATARLPRYYDLAHRLAFNVLVNVGTVWSKALQLALNAEFGEVSFDQLEVRFVPMTVELRTDGSPRTCAVVGGTIGEGVRVSGIGLGMFAPAERRGTRYVDGGVALGVPAAVLPDFGADMVIACNSIVPPSGRDWSAILPFDVGTWLRWNPFVDSFADRWGDAFVGTLTTLRQSARAGAEDADVYYEVSPETTPFFKAFCWANLDQVRQAAADQRGWDDALDRSLACWKRLRGATHP